MSNAVAEQVRWVRRIRRSNVRGPWHQPTGELLPQHRATLGPYAGLRPAWAVQFFRRRYLRSLDTRTSFSDAMLVDVGAGFGWLSLAYVLSGGRAAVAVDADARRLRVVADLVRILAPGHKVWPVVASAEALPFKDGTFGIVASVETLEHVGENLPKRRARRLQMLALKELRRVCSGWILVSTPNRWFFWVQHDVSLPGAHWLPYGLKRLYARVFGRLERFAKVRLLSVPEVEQALGLGKPHSRFLNFDDPEEWEGIFPLRTPYLPQPGRWVNKRGTLQAKVMILLYRLLGRQARYFYPSICGLYAVSARGRRKT